MNKITISKVKKADIPYIKEKLQKYILDSTNLKWSQFFVAKISEKPVAFGRIVNRKDHVEIASLGVDYYHRKEGIGKKIFLFLIEEAKRTYQTKPIYIVTHIPSFFKQFGFEIVRTYPDYLRSKRKRCKLHESRIRVLKYKKTPEPILAMK